MEVLISLLALAGGVFLAAFYAGAETGTYSLNRMRLRLRAEQGMPAAITLRTLLQRPETVIATTLVGHNLAVWFATSFTTMGFNSWWPGKAEVLTSLTLSPVLFVLAEVVPKELFRRQADLLAYESARTLRWSQIVFAAPVWALRHIALTLARLFGSPQRETEQVFSRVRLVSSLGEGRAVGVLTAFQSELAHNIVNLHQQELREVMVPLERVAMLSNTRTRAEAQQLAKKQGFFRYPVYRGEKENIFGVINILDLFLDDKPGLTIRNYVRDVPKVPLDAGLDQALTLIRTERQPLAVVVDAVGRALGIVTAKDLLEEITGELSYF